jgi:hypothetical protein
MTWKCADCNAVETGQYETAIDVVCHHCGKPLCAEDRIWIADDAFHAEPRTGLPVAAHCKGCRQANHPRATAVEAPHR